MIDYQLSSIGELMTKIKKYIVEFYINVSDENIILKVKIKTH